MDLRLAPALALLTVAATLLVASTADAQVGSAAAERIADRDPNVVATEGDRGPLEATVTRDGPSWRVSYFDDDDEVVRVIVDADSGAVRESWTGYQVAWQMARGNEGQFGHVLNAPYVWLPLCAIFLLGLLDWRRPLRIVHLDLVVLLAFGVSHVFFNRGEIGLSAPLAYPPLLYLLARMLWVGFRGGRPLRPTIPALWLAVAAVFLIAFRITLNVADSGVIDVGYAGVIGADRVPSGEPIYGAFPDDNPSGDTYGPAAYYAYIPFELALPWSGEWDELPAAHAAAIAFDLATVAGLVFCGLRLRPGRAGRDLGFVLAFAWLAFPYTAFALQSNSNDSLLAALVVWSLVLFGRPLARGALLALAAATKFAPLVLVPLYAAGRRGLGRRSARPLLGFAAAFALVAALMLAQPAIDPGLGVFWERTIANQADRSSPFSVWGQEASLEPVRIAIVVAVAALALALAFVPRERSPAQVAALAAAALIGAQLVVEHWFYLYLPWFLGPLLVALVAGVGGRRARETGKGWLRAQRLERTTNAPTEPDAG
ncbi:MAG TPA: glycosyltransferase 87 family protein [Solirubrobacterales bacterium]|nr:glycosyltransferase 87 family protein [Solirubrobacterales bacterium]